MERVVSGDADLKPGVGDVTGDADTALASAADNVTKWARSLVRGT